jgi:hypothetical protein
MIWLYITMDIWSRLWISTKVGDRNEDHVKAMIFDTLQRGEIKYRFLFTTDGFKPYYLVIRELLQDRCIYGQVIKKWKNNQVIFVRHIFIMRHHMIYSSRLQIKSTILAALG